MWFRFPPAVTPTSLSAFVPKQNPSLSWRARQQQSAPLSRAPSVPKMLVGWVAGVQQRDARGRAPRSLLSAWVFHPGAQRWFVAPAGSCGSASVAQHPWKTRRGRCWGRTLHRGGDAPAPCPRRSRAEPSLPPARSHSSPASYLLNKFWLGGPFLIVKPSNVAQIERSCFWLGEQQLF